MAQSASANLIASLSRSTPVYKRTVELYKRSWGGAAYSYDEAVDISTYLTDDSDGRVMWKLDKENFGNFRLDNVTLTFRNERNQWLQDNPKGLFPSGKLINQSKIRIKIGAQLYDESYETLYIFTGYISGDPVYDPDGKTVTVTLVSACSIFEKTPAEQISTLVEDELLGQDSGDTFTTANNGVGVIVIVKRGATLGAATEIKPTINYTASDWNMTDTPLTITLVTALTAGEKLYISYRYWYQDKTIEWIVEQVMTAAGISSYSITPAAFAVDVSNTWDFNTQADFEACTLTNIGTKAYEGSFQRKWFLIDDFSDGDYHTNPAWSVSYGTWAIASGKLRGSYGSYPASSIKVPSNKAYGSWLCSITKSDLGLAGQYAMYNFISTPARTGLYGGAGYGLAILSGVVGQAKLVLYRTTGSTWGTSIGSCAITGLDHSFRITRSTDGEFNVYVDGSGTPSITTYDSTYTTSQEICCVVRWGSSGTSWTASFDDLQFSDDVNTDAYESDNPAILTSTVKDCGADVTAYGNLAATYTLYDQAVTFETASSADDISYEDWTAVSATGQILSTVQRYLKWRAKLTTSSNNADFNTPVVDQVTITYYTSTTSIDLVNMTGLNCKQVLDRLTEMCCYEMGFKADDSFVFRPRITGADSILDLTSDTNIKGVRNISAGVERVYNRVTAVYGDYTKVSDASADSEPNSITKYGTREYQVNTSALLPAANVDLAYAVAPTILAYTKTPRRRCTVDTQFILHLELGDKVKVYYAEPTALRLWKWGDTDVVYGQADLEYYNSSYLGTRLNLYGVVMRIEGIEFDIRNWQTSFDLVEVI